MKIEMEIIDQLIGSNLPLSMLAGLFGDLEKAKKVFSIYVCKGIVELQRNGKVMPTWEAELFLATIQNPDSIGAVKVNLTNKGADVFETRKWENL